MIILRATPTIATRLRLQLDLFVEEEAWEGVFDRIEVWRARLSKEGPYEPMHGPSWSAARLPQGLVGDPSSQDGPDKALVGETLYFLVAEDIPVAISFTGSDPLSLAEAATQVAAQSQGLLSSFVVDNALAVETVNAGSSASLRLVGGSAAARLGLSAFEPESVAFGRDARIVLVAGQRRYQFVDLNGSTKYWYKARLVNSSSGVTDFFSLPFQGKPPSSLDSSYLVRGTVDLVNLSGAPAQNQEVLVYSAFTGTQAGGRTVVEGSQRKLSDKDGHAEFLLVRGALVTVSLAGTAIARDVTIPTDPLIDSFSLLDEGVGGNDVFAVKKPRLDYATRRSL